jgi:hypothetical protein
MTTTTGRKNWRDLIDPENWWERPIEERSLTPSEVKLCWETDATPADLIRGAQEAERFAAWADYEEDEEDVTLSFGIGERARENRRLARFTHRGFTLVEMVVILAGIAVLLTVAISATMAGVMP